MKKSEIENVVKHNFKVLSKLFHKIIDDFYLTDIVEFRIKIKQLKCFLHLLNMESPGEEFMLPKKLKTFYGYVGIIRNVQMHENKIKEFCVSKVLKLPDLYLDKLNGEIQSWEGNTREFINQDNNFLTDEDKILEVLPEKLTKESIKNFIRYILFEITMLLSHPDEDEALISIRKFLQDILFNRAYIKHYAAMLSKDFIQENELDSVLAMLDAFRDKCIDITLLQTYCDESWDKEEKKLLTHIDESWHKEKSELMKSIYNRLRLIQFSPDKNVEFSSANYTAYK